MKYLKSIEIIKERSNSKSCVLILETEKKVHTIGDTNGLKSNVFRMELDCESLNEILNIIKEGRIWWPDSNGNKHVAGRSTKINLKGFSVEDLI